jgi:hypothetical protein
MHIIQMVGVIFYEPDRTNLMGHGHGLDDGLILNSQRTGLTGTVSLRSTDHGFQLSTMKIPRIAGFTKHPIKLLREEF